MPHLQLVAGQGVEDEVNPRAVREGLDHVLEGGVAAVANVVLLQAGEHAQQRLALGPRPARGEHLASAAGAP